MRRGFVVLSASSARVLWAPLAAVLTALVLAPAALATGLTPGDVVVVRDGNGGVESITSSAMPVHLDEFGPVGGLTESIALPTAPLSSPITRPESLNHRKTPTKAFSCQFMHWPLARNGDTAWINSSFTICWRTSR